MIYNKYGNHRCEYGGIKFDSKKELARYLDLLILERAGKVDYLKVQPKYIIQESFTDNEGKKQRPITYIWDFEYIDILTWRTVIEDVKASPKILTDVFKIKWKLVKCIYPHIQFVIYY